MSEKTDWSFVDKRKSGKKSEQPTATDWSLVDEARRGEKGVNTTAEESARNIEEEIKAMEREIDRIKIESPIKKKVIQLKQA